MLTPFRGVFSMVLFFPIYYMSECLLLYIIYEDCDGGAKKRFDRA